jgi:hypothetical protein
VWIDFDGVYKNSDVWLNGVFLGHHTSGYVAFRYFLHNVTSGSDDNGSSTSTSAFSQTSVLNFGGDNVIAVRVDALSARGPSLFTPNSHLFPPFAHGMCQVAPSALGEGHPTLRSDISTSYGRGS